jgi:hypothetical protein
MISQKGNASGTLSKGWHMNVENVKAIEEVLPKSFLFDGLF